MLKRVRPQELALTCAVCLRLVYCCRSHTDMTGAAEYSTVTVIPRNAWKAVDVQLRERLHKPADKLIIHHTALWSCWSHTQSITHFLVDQTGVVYEGRGWGIVGAHAKTHNHNSVGVAFMGNFNDESPSLQALSAVRALIQHGVAKGYLQPNFVILGHRDVADTQCPGGKLYSLLHTLKIPINHTF
ncbi:peptidoglycan recognition protein 5 isoform X3 [Neoarius graeffei]|uniref:peptidoglycan recognition protein 5 isoform X3 n=1 Tax=Neoarius graeffei TaxID=443677 RepID=UPI00298CBE9F|nr:peptidoglycan recognition protein 5 isoform X3 [Neoarius graeffei]